MIRLTLAGIAAALLIAGGTSPLAKFALTLGLPQLAALLLSDPAVRGVAEYQAGDYKTADLSFREAGRGSTYNRGLSLALTGDYPLAKAYFDAVLFANPADSAARENRDRINALIPPVIGQGNDHGRIAVTVIATPGGAAVEATMRLGRQLEAGALAADQAWLDSLSDDPGEFLRLRLEAEHQRRLAMGMNPGAEGDPW